MPALEEPKAQEEAEDLGQIVYTTHAEHAETLGDLKARVLADRQRLDDKRRAARD